MRPTGGLSVVKLGGSHAFSPHLRDWLAGIAASAGPIVVVPGGGPFADCVRDAQARMGFNDRAAHHMALVAMEQYGRALENLGQHLAVAASIRSIRRLLGDGQIPVWAPVRMALAATDIPASWDVTSDSLAAWLAGHIGAKRLVLVKRGTYPGSKIRVQELVRRGAVDRHFPHFLAQSGAQAWIAGPGEGGAARTLINDIGVAGVAIDLR